MGKNLVIKEFLTDCCWSVPAGVTSVRVQAVNDPLPPLDQGKATGSSTAAYNIDANGQLFSWGNNDCGNVGDGSITSRCSPVAICPTIQWKCVYRTGFNISWGLTRDGALYTWGEGGSGVGGRGGITAACVPTAVCPVLRFRQICAAGTNSGCMWGLTYGGSVYSWGTNGEGIIGDGSVASRCVPTRAGTQTFCYFDRCRTSAWALDASGNLYTWGDNACGQLGIGSIASACTPTAVCPGLSWSCIKWTCGSRALGLDSCGRLWSWGQGRCGGSGTGDIAAVCVPTLICCSLTWRCIGAFEILTAPQISFGITCQGKMYIWGTAGNVQGDGVAAPTCVPTPVCCDLNFANVSFVPLTSAPCMAYALTCDGKLYTWGNNFDGALGTGDIDLRCVPTPICPTLTFRCASDVGSVCQRMMALTCDGKLYSWGANFNGRIGDGTTISRCSPVEICSSLTWKHIISERNYSIGLTCTGDLYVWGDLGAGSGAGSATCLCTPTLVCCSTKWVCMDSGFQAISVNGLLYKWGTGSGGQIGDGAASNRCLPVPVPVGSTFIASPAACDIAIPVVPGTSCPVLVRTLTNYFGDLPIGKAASRVVISYWA